MLKPGLYIVPTPIGNLEDITKRAIKTLELSDIILCEDTRITKRLLSHYNIKKKMYVYNDYSNKETREKIKSLIEENKVLSLVSDAGTPTICDPGYKLIDFLRSNLLFVDVLPGPCSVITGLILSSLPTDKFVFLGFLPVSHKQRKDLFWKFLTYLDITIIAFERSTRLQTTLKLIEELNISVKVSIIREITKIYQEVITYEIKELISNYKDLKGEIIITLKRSKKLQILDQDNIEQEIQKLIINKDKTSKDISLEISEKFGISKSKAYNLIKKYNG